MQITFALPHVFQPNSLKEENAAVYTTLQACVKEIAKGSTKGSAPPSFAQTGTKQWTFDIPSAFFVNSLSLNDAVALNALLRCLSSINIIYLNFRPSQIVKLYSSGVYYARTVIWDCIPALYERGYGDCKSLTCALVAEDIVQGIPAKPVFRWTKTEDNQTNFHILVQTHNGYEDPSRVLGMNRHENSYFQRTG